MEDTRTSSRCQHCRESLQLSAAEKGELLRSLRVEVLCPQCMRLTEVTALPRKKGSPGASSGSIRASDVTVRKSPSASSGQIGRPPFQPLEQAVRTAAPTSCAPGITSLPFQPMVDAATAPILASRLVGSSWSGGKVRGWLPILAGAALGAAGMLAGLVLLAGQKKDQVPTGNGHTQNARP